MIEIPLRTGNGQNNRGHWTVAARRAKSERAMAHTWVSSQRAKPTLPCIVTLTRVSPPSATGWIGLDSHDNLRGALKHVVDGIADWLGVKDNDPRVTWAYAQERGKWAVRIEFRSVEGAIAALKT